MGFFTSTVRFLANQATLVPTFARDSRVHMTPGVTSSSRVLPAVSGWLIRSPRSLVARPASSSRTFTQSPQIPLSFSRLACWPTGTAVVKYATSYRLWQKSGDCQRTTGRSRSARIFSPLIARYLLRVSSRSEIASRWFIWSLPAVYSATLPSSSPANNSPVSSKVSRTAATTTLWAIVASPNAKVRCQCSASAPHQGIFCASSAVTIPPGKATIPKGEQPGR